QLTTVGWVGRGGVFRLGAEAILIVCAGGTLIGAVIEAKARIGSIDGEHAIEVACVEQIRIGDVNAVLQGKLPQLRIGIGGAKAAIFVKVAHQVIKVVIPAIGGDVLAELHAAVEQRARLGFQRLE